MEDWVFLISIITFEFSTSQWTRKPDPNHPLGRIPKKNKSFSA